ncbi:MAG TPA: FtsK/SpoIIIE domain-containing protein [Microbacteriaceae bacterium]
MRLKVMFNRPGAGTVPLVVTAEPSARVSDIAGTLYRGDPARDGSASAVQLTIQVRDAGAQTPRLIGADATLVESGIRSGSVLELVQADGQFAAAGSTRGAAAAVLRVLSGPDAGTEFPLPIGSSVIGRDRDVDVRLSDPLISKRHVRINVGDTIDIIDQGSANGITVGGQPVARATVSATDSVELGDTVICVVSLQRGGNSSPTTPFVEFVRSPRVVLRFPGEKFDGPTPPTPMQPQRLPYLAIIAPLIMGAVVFLVSQNPLGVIMMGLSPVLVLGTFIDSRVTAKKQLKIQTKRFLAAIESLHQRAADAQITERATRLAEAPGTADVIESLTRLGPLLWTKRPEDPTFLSARLGVGTAPSRSRIELPSANDSVPEHWAMLLNIVDEFSYITDVPLTVDWRTAGALGVAGPRELSIDAARAIVIQAIGLQSPAEMVLCAFTSQQTRTDWDWLPWLPHVTSPHSPILGEHLADAQGSGAALLAQLEGLVDDRSDGAPELRGPLDPDKPGEQPVPVVPSVLVLVEDDAPVDRPRLTRLAERGADVGVHIIWCASTQEHLPAACRTFLIVDGAVGAMVGSVRAGAIDAPVRPEAASLEDARRVAHCLAPVIDAGVPVDDDSDLPQSVSYAALAGTRLLHDGDAVVERWRENNTILDRAAPPQRRRKDGHLRALVGHAGVDPFYIDLRAQGPHALVGGTTGAGKSEFLQAWVLGIASAHSPDRVTFLFVDYKGGSAFADCVNLPHTVGLVTDLSPHLVRRALTSLRAELRHREHLLNSKRAKDLLTLERSGDPDTPPSLIVVIDEFAALAQEVPEFVDGLVDVAQRGRSLGLHLILATQRPAGVIKDNLRANTNLRIALRMADEEDSTDIVGTPLAAHFDPAIPGRGAAKSGPGRLTSFQTGYTGGITSSEPPPAPIAVSALGFGAAAPWEVPSDESAAPAESGPTDIARIVDSISRAAVTAHIPEPRKPWLATLADVYDLSRLPNPRTDERLLLGVLDDPASQSQPTVFYEPDRDGNMALFGTGGSGKSTALRSIAIAAAVTPRGGPVHVYGLDFGANGLRMLEELPHVGAVISGDDEERVIRLLRMLRDLVDNRSSAYAAAHAGTIVEYRRLANAPNEPRILVLIDGIGAFREAYEFASNSAWFTVLAQIAVDGRQVGVHLVIAGDRPNSLPPSIASTVQRRVVLRQASEDDYLLLGVPRDVLDVSSPPGRAIVDDNEMQFAVHGADANVAVQAREIHRLAESMRRQGITGAPAVQRLPERIALQELPAQVAGAPVIGAADASLQPVGVLARGAFMLAGLPGSGRTTALETLARAVARADPSRPLMLLSPRSSRLAGVLNWHHAAQNPAEVAILASTLREELAAGRLVGGAIFVADITEFTGSEAEQELDQLIREALRAELLVIGEAESSTWSQAYTLAQPFKSARRGLVLVPGEMDGDLLFGTQLGRFRRVDFPPGRGFLIEKGRATKLQIAIGGTP